MPTFGSTLSDKEIRTLALFLKHMDKRGGLGNQDTAISEHSATTRRARRPESRRTMSKGPRRNHSSIFKAKVALDAIRGEKTLAELAAADAHPNQVNDWKLSFS